MLSWFGNLVVWWCSTLGITDTGAVQIALGIAGSMTLMTVLYFVLLFVYASILTALGIRI